MAKPKKKKGRQTKTTAVVKELSKICTVQAKAIMRGHASIITRDKLSLAVAITIGKLLIGVKTEVGHGKFVKWCVLHVKGIEASTIRYYMRVAEAHTEKNLKGVQSLMEAYQRIGIKGTSSDKTVASGNHRAAGAARKTTVINNIHVGPYELLNSPVSDALKDFKDLTASVPVLKISVKSLDELNGTLREAIRVHGAKLIAAGQFVITGDRSGPPRI